MHYYNEFDPQAAAWLQVLIDQHLIPEGVVDTRSIVEVTAADLGGFVQCHFFAGIGGWPLALQLAGVPTITRLWTGSCPCQPFSVAGEGKGTADERHLWPVFFDLIRECRPERVFGEQVASAAVLGSSAKPTKRSAGKAVQPVWLDGVFADLESASYACGSSDIPAAGVGAPHIRQRCWWGAVRLADADNQHDDWSRFGRSRWRAESPDGGAPERMADGIKPRLEGYAGNGDRGNESGRNGADQAGSTAEGGESGWMADPKGAGPSPRGIRAALAESWTKGEGSCGMGYTGEQRCQEQRLLLRTEEPRRNEAGILETSRGSEVGFWDASYWHPCRDGKYRRVPVEPCLQPLVNGLSYRVARRRTVRPPLLRGAGNAICPEVGAEFVKAFYEVITP